LAMAAVLHMYWALGGNAGQSVSAPELSGRAVFHFPRYSNAIVAVGLLVAALVLAARSGMLGSGARTPMTAIAARLLAIGFALRAIGEFHYLGFFKSVRGTPFAYYDTWFYNPLFVCLAVICATASLD
jgi:uncharacterized membrane protein YidH (DUF202 family)